MAVHLVILIQFAFEPSPLLSQGFVEPPQDHTEMNKDEGVGGGGFHC